MGNVSFYWTRIPKTLGRILDVLFPKLCIVCNREGEHLCEDCAAFIAINQSEDRRARPARLSALFYAASYEDIFLQKAIRMFKYEPFVRDLAPRLSYFIIAHLSFLDKPPAFVLERTRGEIQKHSILVPIPLFPARKRWRGFNQAEEIAKPLSRFLRIPLAPDVLAKIKNTKPQVELTKEQRAQNVSEAFKVLRPGLVQNKTVILVDDVCTTGATMSEAARVLKLAGARKIYGIVLARG